jgi:hypothetical protein
MASEIQKQDFLRNDSCLFPLITIFSDTCTGLATSYPELDVSIIGRKGEEGSSYLTEPARKSQH